MASSPRARRIAALLLLVLSIGCGPSGKTVAPAATAPKPQSEENQLPPAPSPRATLSEEFDLNSVTLSGDGKHLAVGLDASPTVEVWDVDTGREVHTLEALHRTALSFSPNGKLLAIACKRPGPDGFESIVQLRDVATGKVLGDLHQKGDPQINNLAFASGGRTVAAGTVSLPPGKPAEVVLLDADGGLERAVLRTSGTFVSSVQFTRDGKTLVADVSSPEGASTLELWDLATRTRRASLARTTSRLSIGSRGPQVVLAPDGKTLAAVSAVRRGDHDAAMVKLWDVATGKERTTLAGHGNIIPCLAFSPDGKTLASGSGTWQGSLEEGQFVAGEVKVWDLATGKERLTLTGHPYCITCLAFARDGKILASGGGDVKLWDVATGKERITLRGPGISSPYALMFTPDGATLIVVNLDRTISFWDVGRLLR
jgi:WD40 repeat protein